MYNGEKFRRDCLGGAEEIETGVKVADPVAAKRAKLWAEMGAELIDDEDPQRAIRYLLATIGNLADQNAVNTQLAAAMCTWRLVIPAWLTAVALIWIAVRSA